MSIVQLPSYHTSLIGRTHDVAALTAHLHDPATRMLTIVGASGSGKTRLALEVATAVAPGFPDGVVFVALAPVQDVRFVIPTLAQALDIQEQPDTPLLTTLSRQLAARRMLLLLDNVEQIVTCAPDLATLLAAAPHLTLLLTSQVPLTLALETCYSLPPLAVPADDSPRDPAALLTYPGIALFVERLQHVQPRFILTPTNADAVVAICQRLDGYPLAIELVAAHSAALDPRDLLLLLHRNLAMQLQTTPTTSSRAAILHPVLDWCTSRLPPVGQTLMLRLGVFFGGWTTEAAQAVLTPEEDLETVAEALALLVQKHLVLVETLPGQQPRYVVLDAIHDYSSGRLRRQRRDGLLRARHAAYYAALAHEAASAFHGSGQGDWIQRLREETHNLRTALQWGLGQADTTPALRLGIDLAQFWHTQSLYSEGILWLEQALALTGNAPPADRARTWRILATYYLEIGRLERAHDAFVGSIELYQEIGDLQGYAGTLTNLGNLYRVQGRLQDSMGLYQRSLEIFRQAVPPNERIQSMILSNMGAICHQQGGLADAQTYYEESIQIMRTIGADSALPLALSLLGLVAVDQGNYAMAHARCTESLAMAERAIDLDMISTSRAYLGIIALESGDDVGAVAQFNTILAHYQNTDMLADQIWTMVWLGYVALVNGDLTEAETWLTQAHTLGDGMSSNQYAVELALEWSRLASAQGDARTAWSRLQSIMQEVVDNSRRLLRPSLAEQAALLLLHQGNLTQSTRLWQAADASRAAMGMPRSPSLLRWYSDRVSILVAASAAHPPCPPHTLSTLLSALFLPIAARETA